MPALLVNGIECSDALHAIAANDRGLMYGDGLFETMLLQDGQVRLFEAHLARLAEGCRRLGIEVPDEAQLRAEIAAVCDGNPSGIVKLIVTRGVGTRGYRGIDNKDATRIVSLQLPAPDANGSIRVRWCDTRLARNPLLAGIKHLNRLEQVLAASEWSEPSIEEGLMMDSEDELVCGTASNVFIVRGQEVATPDLRYCGIHGVMRAHVIRLARERGIIVHEEPLWPEDLESATEVFVTNALRGIRPVTSLEHHSWVVGTVTQALIHALENHA